MTREEAIELVKSAFDAWEYQYDTGDDWSREHEARDMAIKALKQEPCDDAIIRHVVKEQMIKYGFNAPDMTVTEFVENLPPVTPQTRWIPCSERLPEEDIRSYAPYDEHLSAFVLVTLQGQTWPYEKKTVKLARYSYTRNDWRVANNNLGKVIAWMPLPEPYKTESENKE